MHVRCRQLTHPVAHVVVRFFVGDVVDKEDALAPAKVGRGNGAEALLAGSVPDQEFEARAVDVDLLDLVVDADGGDEVRVERVAGKLRD